MAKAALEHEAKILIDSFWSQGKKVETKPMIRPGLPSVTIWDTRNNKPTDNNWVHAVSNSL
jgi:hypothetical protein